MGPRGLRTSRRTSDLPLPAERAWAVVASGRRRPQWYADAAPFVVRGALDRLVGGRGRAWEPPGTPLLAAGNTAGFWRVLEAGHDGSRHRLLLEAAVRAPGRVLLHTEVDALDASRSRLRQQVAFEPNGILGHAYLLADLPAREAVLALTHRRLLADLRREAW
ncbi:hypothetical protein GCM10009844_07270 [Nocardioides koreensis]|uniref:DUF2867 domain-containing protein n=1 Tax=Nocardioides koreensis TaxID=433651 RepID=A0ABN2Z9L2_9ACTN